MDLDNEIFQRLQAIVWFSQCGRPVESDYGLPVRTVSDWSSAVKYFCSPHWEDTTLQAGNALTMHLSDKAPDAYQEWNELTVRARDRIKKEVMPLVDAYREQQNLPPVFCDCVRWDLLSAVMEASYKSWRPPIFFGKLLKVYEAGHFPCGWEGEWPNGRLIVI